MRTSRRRFVHSSLAGAVGGAGLGALWRGEAASAALAAEAAAAQGRAPGEIARDESFWARVQDAYAVDRSMINFNNGGVSPSPLVVQEALRRHYEFANQSAARNLWTVQQPQQETVRVRLARLFGCDPEEIAITRNASESLETCLYGLDLKPGDEVLTTDQDYPRMLTTLDQRARREGIVVRKIRVPVPAESHEQLAALFADNLSSRTRLILCCHMVNITGQIFPVREIVRLGRERGIPVVVDGAHAFAQISFTRDELECDYYGVSLHKWLGGPHGSGLLYVRRERIPSLWPLMAAPVPMDADIRKYEEIGTHPVANRLAIAEACVLHETIGPANREARLRHLRDRWANRLLQDRRVRLMAKLDPAHSSGIGTMSIEGVPAADLAAHLWFRHRIVTTAVDHPDVKGIRVTPNVYSTLDEVDLFCDAVEDVLASGLP